MKCLVLILLSFAAGCAAPRAANPYLVGTREYQQWEDDRNVQQSRRTFMFEGHGLSETTTPPGSVPPEDRDR